MYASLFYVSIHPMGLIRVLSTKLAAFSLLAAVAMASACAHPQVASFDNSAKAPSVREARQIAIYRTERADFAFSELGLITFRTSDLDLENIYRQLRAEAGPHGADAIIDLKLTAETHREIEPVQRCANSSHCDAEGRCDPHQNCWTEWLSHDVSSYLATGTLIRRKE